MTNVGRQCREYNERVALWYEPQALSPPPTTYSNVAYYTILYYDDDMTLLRCLTAGGRSGLNEFPEIKVTLCDSDWLDSGDNEVEES